MPRRSPLQGDVRKIWACFSDAVRKHYIPNATWVQIRQWLRHENCPFSCSFIWDLFCCPDMQSLLVLAKDGKPPPAHDPSKLRPVAEVKSAEESPSSASVARPEPEHVSPFARWNIPAAELDGPAAWKALVQAATARAVAEKAMRNREVYIPGDDPIGIICMGDMHIGSVGTNYERLEQVIGWVESHERVYAVSIGDILDSMVWRSVMHEGRKSPVDFPGEVRAGAYFLERLAKTERLLGICAGNHDLISGKLSGFGALDAICEYVISHIPYHPYQLDLRLQLVSNAYTMTLRHSVQGNSAFNPAHGVAKFHRFTGDEADVVVAGHTHRSGVQPVQVQGRRRWGVQVGAYKVSALDGYALEHGFPDEKAEPDYMVILWPNQHKIEVMETAQGMELMRVRSASGQRTTRTPSRRGTSPTAACSPSSLTAGTKSPSRSKARRKSRISSPRTKRAKSSPRRSSSKRRSSNG